ncbi:PLDc N-terminal domain-containing protein [Litoribacter ruber]|uniref:PLDc N-terminal domain-containing protein n=1 Tax=Litoribacter ruber TaxID=702568 RepID=A0AAP2CKB6_9BACT|nr:PLDc N-terminal domain-containing protein [Litoribacter alkaliphilus]MBT0809725.1 PLDc N-terminal domain-containing protein [Litoribacter ruber]
MFRIGPDGFPFLWGILGVLYLVFWIMTLVDAVRSNFRDPTMKIIWILIILLAQVFGPILYWLLSPKQKV